MTSLIPHCVVFFLFCLFTLITGSSFDFTLNEAEVKVCLDPPLNVEKLDKCLNSSSNNIKKWSYLPDSGECAFLSAAQECAVESGNDFKTERECRETCFYAKCFTAPAVIECDADKDTDYWFYNPSNGTCVKYHDNECPSNANSFEHEMDCYAACSKASCAMGVDRGDCRGRPGTSTIQRWFMNVTSGHCEQFSYDNCLNSETGYRGGNLNNYLSEKECVDMCRCKEDELPGMSCHPALLRLKSSTTSDDKYANISGVSTSRAVESSTRLPHKMLTHVNQTSTTRNNAIRPTTADPHHGHNHEGHGDHESHSSTSTLSTLSLLFPTTLFFASMLL